ncbi:PLP-dependent aminotransferase family protein [Methylobacterium oryzihabitans]|uniref:8-amino-7-oxononanoate synthase n=1 Tax=Methylobacterium oryzihabitans TaxID=2499852 RepID=A0A3S2XGB7_9HYPH|nr:PLP-dependent aminotransferase family protein [Methylobacterium oryzihabitans]RVU14062.1 PLP-dependent aminotransferase family protein [Methylobacterium oryzihabitans]
MGQSEEDGVARRIVSAIKRQIEAGCHRPGDRLPSTRAFAAEWGASRTTVTAAYSQLIAEGYLATRPGARAVVAGGLAAPAQPAGPPGPRPDRLSSFARRLLALPPPAATETHRVADFRYGDLSAADFPVLAWRRALNAATLRRGARLRYDDPQGSGALRAALQGYLWRARGIACAADDIVIVNGSQQGLDLCARLLLDPGERFAIENPGYALARHAFLAAGGVAAPVPVDGDGLQTDALPAARLAYVTPSHQYPLGGVLPAPRRRALVAWAARHGAWIVEDDYDGEYRHAVAPIPPLRSLDPDRVIYVGTVSKTLSPTLRLGYLVVPAALRRAFAEAKRLTDRHTPPAEQEALADLLASGAYERHVRVMRKRNAGRRAALLRALAEAFGPGVRVVGAETGLHVVAWFDAIPAAREASLAAAAREAGIGLYPVSPLYAPAGPRPAVAGFVLGYAGLSEDEIRRGVAASVAVVAGQR